MATYDGKQEWKPFGFQFARMADKYGWDDDQRLDKLIECLRDKALKFFSTRPVSSYHLLFTSMDAHFGQKDPPSNIRRHLQDLHQQVDESLEEFVERAQELAADGYPEAPDTVVESPAVDAFLKGLDSNGPEPTDIRCGTVNG